MSQQLQMTFDRPLAEKLRDLGIARAEAANLEGVQLARELAVVHARRYGTVTADDVRAAFCHLDLEWLGNAAGCATVAGSNPVLSISKVKPRVKPSQNGSTN